MVDSKRSANPPSALVAAALAGTGADDRRNDAVNGEVDVLAAAAIVAAVVRLEAN